MYVKIGPYRNYYGPYNLADLLKYVGVSEDRRAAIGEWLDNTWVRKLFEWYYKKFSRKVKVRIDRYDTWSMDHTLAPIILPMLKQLKATKHGAPYVDQEDLPKELRLTKRQKKVFDDGHWDKSLNATKEEIDEASKVFFSQFDWILDQMIWSFEQQLDEDEGRNFYYEPYASEEELEADMRDDTIVHEDGTVTKELPLLSKEWRRKMGKLNIEKHKAYAAKKQFGFTMFGKYFQSLWD